MSNRLKTVFLLGFLLAFHYALVSYINSSFLSTFIDEGRVGLVYTVGATLTIVALLLVPNLLRLLGGYKFLLTFSFLCAILLFILSSVSHPLAIACAFVLYFTMSSLVSFVLDEFIQIFSENTKMGVTRGLYLTAINIAWIIAQFINGKVLVGADFSLLYLLGAILLTTIFVVAFFALRNTPDPKYSKATVRKSVMSFIGNKNLVRSYLLNFLLQLFFSWMVIYTPLYLSQHIGFTWPEISIIFMIMLLPFSLIQIPLGYYSDQTGERRMLMYGFLIMSLATLSLFFISGKILLLWAFVLFMTRVGAATVEIMADVYFFKHINKENDELIGIYRNATSVAYIVGPLLATILLVFLPSFHFLYLVLGATMLFGVQLAHGISKSDI